MAKMEHGKVMHLINQADYELLQSVKKKGSGVVAPAELPVPSSNVDSDEVRMKQYNEGFIRDEKERKFKEDVE